MASPALLLAQCLGLDVYDPPSAELAVQTLLRIRQIFPARQSCVSGGMAMVHYVGKQNYKIAPTLELLVSVSSPKLIGRHFHTQDKAFQIAIPCGAITIKCTATTDVMEKDIIAQSKIANMAGSLVRVVSPEGLMALKFVAGQPEDLRDLRLLLCRRQNNSDDEAVLGRARDIIARHYPNRLTELTTMLSGYDEAGGAAIPRPSG